MKKNYLLLALSLCATTSLFTMNNKTKIDKQYVSYTYTVSYLIGGLANCYPYKTNKEVIIANLAGLSANALWQKLAPAGHGYDPSEPATPTSRFAHILAYGAGTAMAYTWLWLWHAWDEELGKRN